MRKLVLFVVFCATSVSAIIRGNVVGETDVPWAALVMFSNEKEPVYCGAVLVHPRWILSSANCVRHGDESALALLGAADILKIHQTIPIVNVTRHEKFNSLTFHNDIALLELAWSASVNEFVEPIRIPSRVQEKNTFNNVNSWAAGWGYDGDSSVYPVDKLRETGIHVILNFNCWFTYPYVDDTQICTSGNGVPCDGDEGGPLWIMDSDRKPTLIGLVSYEDLFCTTLYPAVYARLTHYLDWIHTHSKMEIEIRDA